MPLTMFNRHALQTAAIWVGIAVACPLANRALGQPAVPEKISSYAPAAELISQLDLCVQALAESLTDAEAFESKSKTFAKNSATVVVIAQHLALHDESHDWKESAPALFHAAATLAECEDYDAAQAAFATLQAVVAGESSEAEMPTWDPVVEMEPLMEQVGFLNSKLRRGVRRLKRGKEDIARRSAVLAALSQAVLPDLSFVADDEDAKKWFALCAEMRDACATLHAAAVAGDEDAARTAVNALDQSCKECHDIFR